MKILTFENCEFTHVNGCVQTTVVDEIHICIDTFLPLLIISYCFIYLSSQHITTRRYKNIEPIFPDNYSKSCQAKNRPTRVTKFLNHTLSPITEIVDCFGGYMAPPRWSLHRCQLHRNRHPTLRERSGEVVSKRRAFEMLNRTSWDDILKDLEDEMNEKNETLMMVEAFFISKVELQTV